MEEAYDYVATIQGMDTPTKQLEAYIEEILRQTVECALFIKEYCGKGFAGALYLNLRKSWEVLELVL